MLVLPLRMSSLKWGLMKVSAFFDFDFVLGAAAHELGGGGGVFAGKGEEAFGGELLGGGI